MLFVSGGRERVWESDILIWEWCSGREAISAMVLCTLIWVFGDTLYAQTFGLG
jgi:hypothetical protein